MAFSNGVGLANTAARYFLSKHTAVRRVLREFCDRTRQKEMQTAAAAVRA